MNVADSSYTDLVISADTRKDLSTMSDKIIFFNSSLERLSSLLDWAVVAVSAAEERRGRRDAETAVADRKDLREF